jgi:UDP-GlcNAc:undecaprenyl-phosphate GlcNAc-1-phosphate transferase
MTPEIRTFLSFLVALFAALFVMPKLSSIADRIGLIDKPDARKIHHSPRPLVGGIGIVISATFSSLLFVPLVGLRGFFSGLAVLLLVGFLDDYTEVGHRKKFLAQILATALLIYFSKVQLSNFGNLLGFGDIIVPHPEFLIWCVTVFCVVGVTNAVNMIDGLDGLAGGVSFLAFLTFAVFSSMAGNSTLMLLNLAFCGAILGFLKYNWSPSTLFMGDSGSLCLGFSLSFMAVALTQTEGAIVPPISMLLVLAVPISDTIGVMTKRMVRRNSPFKPDRTHLHHILLQAGLTDSRSVGIILMLSTLFCLLGVFAVIYSIPEPILFAVFLGYFLLNYFFPLILPMLFKQNRG